MLKKLVNHFSSRVSDKAKQGLYMCFCGNKTITNSWRADRGDILSCGCLVGKNSKHNMTSSPEWLAWVNIKRRCYNPKNASYKHYGGRGIKMCEEWVNSFKAFYTYIGPRPNKSYSIDRKDVNGDYEPGNVRWASDNVQRNNRTNSDLHTYKGKTQSLGAWCKEYNLDRRAIRSRVKVLGWSLERALNTPFKINK